MYFPTIEDILETPANAEKSLTEMLYFDKNVVNDEKTDDCEKVIQIEEVKPIIQKAAEIALNTPKTPAPFTKGIIGFLRVEEIDL